VQGLEQSLGIVRFCKEIRNVQTLELGNSRFFTLASGSDKQGLWFHSLDCTNNRDAIHVRHRYVGEDDIDEIQLLRKNSKRLGSIARLIILFQNHLRDAANALLVVHEKD
jgi:hypothetical protein